jgi:hypothetical protein
MKYPFISYRDPATEEEIQSWETLNGIRLPEQYRNFLSQSNGAGTYEPWAFEYTDLETKKLTTDGVFSFLALEDIKGVIEQLADGYPWGSEGYHSHELLPIAFNHCHSCTTMIGYQDDDYGRIILLDYLGYEDENGKIKKVYLADSFEAFLNIFLRMPGYEDWVMPISMR